VSTELSLVRHGETDWNRQRRIQGLTDIPLNETGREQARQTGHRLTRRRWDRIYSSPLSRARETAAIIAAEVGLPDAETVDALIERDYGDAEGLNFAEVERRYPDRSAVPGQESREDVMARVVPALRTLAAEHAGESILVVSHGGAIRAVLAAVDPETAHGVITNGSVHSFRSDTDRLHLVAFDDPIDGGEGIDAQNAVEAREDGLA
jgi:broad specificity phosphatase PhoE